MGRIIVPMDIEVEKGKNLGGKEGYIYILHFSEKISHAQHYIGWTYDVDKRMALHENGGGAKIVKAAMDRGVEVTLVRLLTGDGNYERSLKNRKECPRFCPICNPDSYYKLG